MKVKFLESISTPETSFDVGQEYDIDKSLAGPWVESGVCEPVAKTTRKKAAKKQTALNLQEDDD